MEFTDITCNYAKAMERLEEFLKTHRTCTVKCYQKDENGNKITGKPTSISAQEQFWLKLHWNYEEEWQREFNHYLKIFSIGLMDAAREEEKDSITNTINLCPFDSIDLYQLEFCMRQRRRLKREKAIEWAVTVIVSSLLGEMIGQLFFC